VNSHRLAKRLWKRAAWIHGDGPIAVIAYCNVTTVTLHSDPEVARHSVDFIDEHGCGGNCYRHHRVVDLGPLLEATR
jgi:hypothetical protein